MLRSFDQLSVEQENCLLMHGIFPSIIHMVKIHIQLNFETLNTWSFHLFNYTAWPAIKCTLITCLCSNTSLATCMCFPSQQLEIIFVISTVIWIAWASEFFFRSTKTQCFKLITIMNRQKILIEYACWQRLALFNTRFSRTLYKASFVTMNTEYIDFLCDNYTKRIAKR